MKLEEPTAFLYSSRAEALRHDGVHLIMPGKRNMYVAGNAESPYGEQQPVVRTKPYLGG